MSENVITIATRWEEVKAIIHPDAPPIQIREMRRAFYAGALSALELILNTTKEGIEVNTATKRIQGWLYEVMEFGNQIERDEA